MNTEAEIKAFFDQWNLYKKLIQYNYMHHEEIGEKLHSLLSKFFTKPITVLDLGCGDAYFTAKKLDRVPISRYVGVDLSEIALQLAEKNLAKALFQKSFHQAEFCHFVEHFGQKVDVVFVGFSLHHLGVEQKERFFQLARRVLNDQGHLIICDPVRGENETRAQFLYRYITHLKQHWKALTEEDINLIQDHVIAYDYQETRSALFGQALRQGFGSAESHYQDKELLHELLTFSV